jgi:hypothetical protein
MNSNQFEHLRTHKDSLQSQYIFVIFDFEVNDTIEYIYHYLEKLNKLFSKDPFKKNVINGKIYSLIEYIKSNYNLTEKNYINNIYFIDKGNEIIDYKLTIAQINTLNKFKCRNCWTSYGEFFDIDKLNQYVNDDTFDIVIKVDGNKITQSYYGKEKKIEVDKIDEKSFNLLEYLSTIPSKPLIYGKSVLLKSLDTLWHVYNEFLDDSQIYHKINELKMTLLYDKLQLAIDKIKHPKECDFVKFKNELQKGIEEGMVKELFINPKKYKIIYDKYSSTGLLNFPIYVIESINSGDIGDEFNTSYSGVIWIVRYLY